MAADRWTQQSMTTAVPKRSTCYRLRAVSSNSTSRKPVTTRWLTTSWPMPNTVLKVSWKSPTSCLLYDGAVTEYQIDTENILARHRQLSGLKSLASSAQKMTDRSFELYGPTNTGDFAKWLGRSGNLAAKPQFGQLVQAHQQLITTHGVYGWLQVLLTGAVYQYQRDYNMGGRTADTTYLSSPQ